MSKKDTKKEMKIFEVQVREVHIQPYIVKAMSPEMAIDLIVEGSGELIEAGFEYSHTLDKESWTVKETSERD